MQQPTSSPWVLHDSPAACRLVYAARRGSYFQSAQATAETFWKLQIVDMPLLIEVGAHHLLRPCVVVTCSHEIEVGPEGNCGNCMKNAQEERSSKEEQIDLASITLQASCCGHKHRVHRWKLSCYCSI